MDGETGIMVGTGLFTLAFAGMAALVNRERKRDPGRCKSCNGLGGSSDTHWVGNLPIVTREVCPWCGGTGRSAQN